MLDTAKMEAQFAPLVANFFASFYYCNTSTGCPASGMYVNDLCVWGWGGGLTKLEGIAGVGSI